MVRCTPLEPLGMCIAHIGAAALSGHPAAMALSAEPRPPLTLEMRGLREENRTLYGVIKLVSSALELEPMLQGVVDLATEARGCHACFIYLVEDGVPGPPPRSSSPPRRGRIRA